MEAKIQNGLQIRIFVSRYLCKIYIFAYYYMLRYIFAWIEIYYRRLKILYANYFPYLLNQFISCFDNDTVISFKTFFCWRCNNHPQDARAWFIIMISVLAHHKTLWEEKELEPKPRLQVLWVSPKPVKENGHVTCCHVGVDGVSKAKYRLYGFFIALFFFAFFRYLHLLYTWYLLLFYHRIWFL